MSLAVDELSSTSCRQLALVDELSRSISCQVDQLSVDEFSVDELSVGEYSSHRESDEGKKFYEIDI